MNNGPVFTYELACMRLDELDLQRTGSQVQPSDQPAHGRMRITLGNGLIAVGRWLAGTGPITPVAGTH